MTLNSRIYEGWVRHRRYSPAQHRFTYPLFMLYLDLDEIDDVFSVSRFWSAERFNWASFRRADYFDPATPDLKQAVIKRVCDNSDLEPGQIKSVRILTHVRYLGYVFNPVSVYYLFDDSEQLLAVMPEITNTPWKERHTYVLMANAQTRDPKPEQTPYFPSRIHRHYREYRLRKAFHVSPFLPMAMDYRWVFGLPEPTLRIHLENHKDEHKVFDATLVMHAEPVTAQALRRALIRFPAMTVKVATGIHWHALKLWLKKVPFIPHPNKEKKEKTA
jgi:DUF1365 family protein